MRLIQNKWLAPLAMAALAAAAGGVHAADPARTPAIKPVDLAALRTPPRKEPRFGSPRYCLLAFGPAARKQMWVVVDGSAVYADRHGDGDLTHSDDHISGKHGVYVVGEAAARDDKTADRQVTIRLNETIPVGDETFRTVPFVVSAMIGGTRGGAKGEPGKVPFEMRAWPSLTPRPEEAPVVHFNGPLELRLNRKEAFIPGIRTVPRFRVQTAGLGEGADAIVFYAHVPGTLAPTARFRFPTADPDHPAEFQVRLNNRCCEAFFWTPIQVPANAAVGGTAQIDLAFSEWKEGHVRPSREEASVVKGPPGFDPRKPPVTRLH